MADFTVSSDEYAAVTLPDTDCKMQVHGAPVHVTFEPAGTVTKGLRLRPGDVLPIAAGQTLRARKVGSFKPILSFEVFG